jgi:hypothetical protein
MIFSELLEEIGLPRNSPLKKIAIHDPQVYITQET